ncbi:hypothetical protein [Petropleomorpha daqingensis]|uniref:Uncharacterized protein n=1 Tax=Petropleomorpha daqingensis TaxID=2026353 RepID=A0A853CEG7_9ACTN|nr:hypothetical protein [Petropleomorpha daqingensis]NYJ05449.1 hypothetical protein [Petropleomorpha daqingensis]
MSLRWFIAAGAALLVLAGVLVALVVSGPSSASEPAPAPHTTTIENHCTGISRDKPC